jgi:hypothetical protein
VLSPGEIADAGCSAYYLISDPNGTPAAPNGVNLHDHLAGLAAAGSSTTPTTTTPPPATTTTPAPSTPGPTTVAPTLRTYSARPKADGSAVRFVLRASQSSSGVISARTVNAYAVGKKRRQRVALGKVGFVLTAGTSKTVVLRLTTSARALLRRQHTLKAQITITLTNAAHRRGVSQRPLTIKAPAHR